MRLALIIVSVASTAAGCVVVPPPPPPPPPETMVELVNETGLTVDAHFFIGADASDEGGLFVSGNLFTEYSDRPIPTLGAHKTVRFGLACDRIRSMGVSRPIFVNTITFMGGVSDDQMILLRASDYACGDTLRFVYFAEEDVFRVRLERPSSE